MKKILFLILIFFSFIFYSGFACKQGEKEKEDILKKIPEVTLEYWRTVDDQSAFSDLITEYEEKHPKVKINIRFFRQENFKEALKNAWIDDVGPDIFSIPATWMGEYVAKNKLLEMPASTKVWEEVIVDARSNEKTYQEKVDISITAKELKNKYIDVAYGDVVRFNKIYGLPLAVDTLALYYNRDLLNKARIEKPPLTWVDLANDARNLRVMDGQTGNIVTAGVAMGLVSNVSRAFDIVSLLMMQGGSKMECGESFCLGSAKNGMLPVEVYTSFANPNDNNYTWNEDMPNSIDAFSLSKVAYFLGYSYQNKEIKSKNPSLNYYISPVPQLENANPQINYANYFVEVVARSGMNESVVKREIKQNIAWDFVKYIANEKNVMKYLDKTKKPTALRFLIDKQKENADSELSVFLDQSLTARNWYHGKDYEKAESVLNELILKVLESETSGETLKEIEEAANNKLKPTW